MKTFTSCILVLLLLSCSDKDMDGCESRVSFDTEIKEFVTYLPDDISLTPSEAAVAVPFYQYYAFDFCKTSDKKSKGSITNFVDKTPIQDAPSEALGIEKNIRWRTEFNNEKLTVYKDESDLVDEVEVKKISEKMLSCLTMFSTQPLISKPAYEKLMNDAKNEFTVTNMPNGDFKLSKKQLTGYRTETVFSNDYQRETAHAVYDGVNELRSLHTWYYRKNDSTIALDYELMQVFSPSPDSDKTIVVNRLTKYKNVVIK